LFASGRPTAMGISRAKPLASYRDKTLLLLYSSTESAVLAEDLFEWSKHSHFGSYKRDVLQDLDNDNLVEYDRATESVILSPLGVKRVEEEVIGRELPAAPKPATRRTTSKRR
jgi:hypothetical protein